MPDLFRAAPAVIEDPAITETVQAFYEEYPFPDYREHDEVAGLVRRGRQNPFTAALDRAIPPQARVVELGCGTGQLSMFLAATGRRVVGLDLSASSLDVAENFRNREGVGNLQLVRANLFDPPLPEDGADWVISSGVLHHTGAARAGFRVMTRLARPGGYVLVGLYNRFGRALLPLQRRRNASQARTRRGLAWWKDQHEHPHETRHTLGEVQGWIDEEGLDFLRWIPPLPRDGDILRPEVRSSVLGRAFLQLSWIPRAEDGGLWITLARRSGRACNRAGDDGAPHDSARGSA